MKKYILLVLFLIITGSSILGQGTWNKTNSPVSSYLRRCFFVDSLYGWIAGDSGLILHTSNGGNNWVTQNFQRTQYFQDLYFVNRQVGYGVAWNHNFMEYGSFIYKTTNGGLNWNYSMFPDTMVFILSICFIDNNTGFFGTAVSPNRSLYKTTNGGDNWYVCNVDSNIVGGFPVRNIRFLNQNTGIAVGGYIDIAGVVWRTTNTGANWYSNITGSEPLNSMVFRNGTEIYTSGGDFEYGVSMCVSSNSGANWEYIWVDAFGMGTSIAMRTSTEMWISTGFSQRLIMSTNFGTNWTAFDSPDSTVVNWITFPNQNTGWAVGDKGNILKFTPSSSVITGNEYLVNKNFELYQNYPNPFNPVTTIYFEIKEDENITLIVFDMLGREVRKPLQNKRFTRGYHKIEFDGSGLTSGNYFYTMYSGEYKMTRKMTILK